MISVLNHRQPLSGNKAFILLSFVWILGACSPKIQTSQPSSPHKPDAAKKEDNKQAETEKKKAAEPQVGKISLILPFELSKIDLSAAATRSGISKADLAVDYYQGFKLALDSLTTLGYNFKLQVFDSKDERAKLQALAFNPQVRLSDLVVGPVFPDGIKSFSEMSVSLQKPIVSPLSPTSPSDYKNNRLITLIPPLEYHAYRAAEFVKQRLKPKKVFILNSGFNDDKKYSVPFKRALDSLSNQSIIIVEKTISRGNLQELIPQLSTTQENVFVIPSDKQEFMQVTIRSLNDLAAQYPITLIGHPSWPKVSFLRPEMLQNLKTRITSSDQVDYKSAATVNFIRNYRNAFNFEPGDFAIKGFDEGWYLGSLLGQDPALLDKLDQNDMQLLHNKFEFIKTPTSGWVNKHVYIMKYENFELKIEE